MFLICLFFYGFGLYVTDSWCLVGASCFVIGACLNVSLFVVSLVRNLWRFLGLGLGSVAGPTCDLVGLF